MSTRISRSAGYGVLPRSVVRTMGLALAAVTVVALTAGCSSKKSNASNENASSNPPAASQSQSSAAASASSASAPASTKAAGGDSNSKFCQELQTIAKSEQETNPGNGSTVSPAILKQVYNEYKSVRDSLLSAAPSDIKPDLTTLFGYLDKIYDMLSKAGFDWTKVDPTQLAPFAASASALGAAANHVDSYIKNTCGVDLGNGSVSPAQ